VRREPEAVPIIEAPLVHVRVKKEQVEEPIPISPPAPFTKTDRRPPDPPPSDPISPKKKARRKSERPEHPAPDHVDPVNDGPITVALFLGSLRPSQLSKLSLFESLGVTTSEELFGLAHMTEKSLESFLARAVRRISISI
jgi:hypothetical protein